MPTVNDPITYSFTFIKANLKWGMYWAERAPSMATQAWPAPVLLLSPFQSISSLISIIKSVTFILGISHQFTTFRTTGWLKTVNISVGKRWWAGSVSSTWKTRFYDPPHTQSINAIDQWPLGSHATYLATRAPSGVAADVTVTVPTLLPWRTINRFSYCPYTGVFDVLFDLQDVTVAVAGHVTVGRS